MAEKIVRPDSFTKEWFGYIWDYYKAYIITGILAIVFFGVLIVQMVNSVEYDANINYIAKSTLSSEQVEKLAFLCSQNSDDLNDNRRVDISVNQLNFTDENIKNSQMHQALLNKMMVTLNSNDELIFVVDKYILDQLVKMKYTEDVFYKSVNWTDSFNEENEYAVSLSDSATFKELGIDASDLYVLVAKADNENGFKPQEENAIKIAKFLLK